MTKLILPYGKAFKSYIPFVLLHFLLVSIQRAQRVLDIIPMQSMLNLLTVIYFSKYVHCDMRFLVVKINALPDFLTGFGKLGHYLYNGFTRWLPTKW